MKQKVQGCSSVGIIHRAACPGWVFMTTKTPGYPVLGYVGKGLLVGGNWVGLKAADDGSPLKTFLRENQEETSFGNDSVEPGEMEILFGSGHLGHPTAPRNIVVEPKDVATLIRIVTTIESCTKPFGTFIQKVAKEALDRKNPKNTKEGFWGILSVFSVPLPDDEWFALVDLQEEHGNLSNESQSVILSVWEIIEKKIEIAWGQDLILEEFFATNGFETDGMPMMRGVTMEAVGEVRNSYTELMEEFEIQNIPDGILRPTT